MSDLVGATQSWNALGVLSTSQGKKEAAELWYRKAIDGAKKTGNKMEQAQSLNNLANLLQTQPDRLSEARQRAQEALTIDKTLDSGAAEIWSTYDTLAMIADKEAAANVDTGRKAELEAESREYRRLAREAKRNFALVPATNGGVSPA